MNSTTTTTPAAEQLTLFPQRELPARFLLSDATRRRGMRHVAELKALLDARAAERSGSSEHVDTRSAALGSRRRPAA